MTLLLETVLVLLAFYLAGLLAGFGLWRRNMHK